MTAGQVVATGTCLACDAVFVFDPELVPCVEGQPICQRCVERSNPNRVALGLPAITYAAGAYP